MGNRVANDDQRRQRAIAVAHGRDAVLELRLCRLDDEIDESVFIAHHRLAVVVQREVHVGVDETGSRVLSSRVDDPSAFGHLRRRARADGGDALPAHDDRRIGDGLAAIAIDDRRTDDRDEAVRGHTLRR